jgi:hypothetical protein
MNRTVAALLALAVLGACRDYKTYPRLAGQGGYVPADQYARYGREQAQQVAIGREFAAGYEGDAPEQRARQAANAIAYASKLPDVTSVVADSLGYRLTVQFASGWRVAVLPIDDGKRGADTPGLPAAGGAAPAK